MTQVLAHEQVLAVHTSLEVSQGRSLVIQVRSLGVQVRSHEVQVRSLASTS